MHPAIEIALLFVRLTNGELLHRWTTAEICHRVVAEVPRGLVVDSKDGIRTEWVENAICFDMEIDADCEEPSSD